jgi:hypothetical protein
MVCNRYWGVFGLISPYIPKMQYVIKIKEPWKCFQWYSACQERLGTVTNITYTRARTHTHTHAYRAVKYENTASIAVSCEGHAVK